MKVTLMGFSLEFPKSELTTADQFYEHLQKTLGHTKGNQVLSACEIPHNGHKWFGGVLITDKEARHIAVKIKEAKKFRVKPQALGKDTTVTDFNFFVYYPQTGRGIYQAYYRSVTVNQFLEFLDLLYRDFKADKLTERQSAGPIDEKDFQRLRKDVKRRLGGRIIVKREELPKLLEALERIKNIEFEFSSLDGGALGELTGMAGHARHHTHRLTYSADAGRIIKQKAVELFSKTKVVENLFKRVKITGVGPTGLEQAYALANNPDKFGEADYDEWIQEVDLDSSDWAGCLQKAGIVKRLLHVTDEKRVKAILLTPVK